MAGELFASPIPDPSRAGDSGQVKVSADRQGAVFTSSIIRRAAMAGKLFVANFGTVTTPQTLPATQAITAKRPSMWIDVPANKSMYVVRHVVTIEVAGATTQGEIAIATTNNKLGAGTSTDATSNQNAVPGMVDGDEPSTDAYMDATADVEAEVSYSELDRQSFAASAVNQKFEFELGSRGIWIPVRGPDGACFACYIGGNAVQVYGQTLYILEDADLAY